MRFGVVVTYIQLNSAYGAYAQAVEQLGTSSRLVSEHDQCRRQPGRRLVITFQTRVDPQGKLPCPAELRPTVLDHNLLRRDSDPRVPLTTLAATATKIGPSMARTATSSPRGLLSTMACAGSTTACNTTTSQPRLELLLWRGQRHRGSDADRAGRIADKSPVGQFWKPSWGTFAPRVGFAYDFFGNGPTAFAAATASATSATSAT